jgi:cell division protein FtsA
MDSPIVVGIDIGTTKVCTLSPGKRMCGKTRILGVGIEPSQGIRKGVVVDLGAASQAIARSVEKAERTSAWRLPLRLVSLAGSHVSSVNSRGVVGITGQTIDHDDIARAIDSARAVAIPHNREVIHVIQRGFTVDGQEGISNPTGNARLPVGSGDAYHHCRWRYGGEPAPMCSRVGGGCVPICAESARLCRGRADRHGASDGGRGV